MQKTKFKLKISYKRYFTVVFAILFYVGNPVDWLMWFEGFTLWSKNQWEFCQLILKNQNQQQVLYSARMYM